MYNEHLVSLKILQNSTSIPKSVGIEHTSDNASLCYALKIEGTKSKEFSLVKLECRKQARPICLMKKSVTYPGQPIPKFPCTVRKSIRNKRDAAQKKNGTVDLAEPTSRGKSIIFENI